MNIKDCVILSLVAGMIAAALLAIWVDWRIGATIVVAIVSALTVMAYLDWPREG